MNFFIWFPLLGLAVVASLSPSGQKIATVLLWAAATLGYAFLFWIWLVLLDGTYWVQWLFGFAVLMSFIPAFVAATLIECVKNYKGK